MPKTLDISLATDVVNLPGIGPYRGGILNRDGIFTAKDLLYYFPIGYIGKQQVDTFAKIKQQLLSEDLKKEIVVTGRLVSISERRIRNGRSMVTASIADSENKRANLVFFNRSAYHKAALTKDKYYVITGKPEVNKYGLQFAHPTYRLATRDEITEVTPAEVTDREPQADSESGIDSISPRYSIKEPLAKSGVTNIYFRKLIKAVCDSLVGSIEESLPKHLLQKRDLPPLNYSIRNLHFPDTSEILEKAIKRMKYQEILEFLVLLKVESQSTSKAKGVTISPKSPSAREVYDKLPFELTNDQKKTLREIGRDLESGKAMNRLLQGDVGAGKTLVALLSMLMAVDSGYQALLIAPTEILAEQHYGSFLKYLAGSGISVELLTGGQKQTRKTEALSLIATGMAQIVVGTHALIQKNVKYKGLGYIVIDEQHRFGVEQRATLRELALDSLQSLEGDPHVLLMSATPIPRTISMSIYGDLSLSFIKTKPALRKDIITVIKREPQREDVYTFCDQELLLGNKIFMLYPLVEDSEKMDLVSVESAYQDICARFCEKRVAILHGRMSSTEKDTVMDEFKKGVYSILVSTTVIEVGIDIPEATVMVINHAERFGLSQLHQLRGRVGRSDIQSYCFLMSDSTNTTQKRSGQKKDLFSRSITKSIKIVETVNPADNDSNKRLSVMEESNDGFYISEKDLEIRGPGDILGVRQSGIPDFKFLDLQKDIEIIQMAREDSDLLLEDKLNSEEVQQFIKRTANKNQKRMINVG